MIRVSITYFKGDETSYTFYNDKLLEPCGRKKFKYTCCPYFPCRLFHLAHKYFLLRRVCIAYTLQRMMRS